MSVLSLVLTKWFSIIALNSYDWCLSVARHSNGVYRPGKSGGDSENNPTLKNPLCPECQKGEAPLVILLSVLAGAYLENLILWRGTVMVKTKQQINSGETQSHSIEISDKQIEIFARRLLPEIKRFFANEDIRREFEDWQKKRQDDTTE